MHLTCRDCGLVLTIEGQPAAGTVCPKCTGPLLAGSAGPVPGSTLTLEEGKNAGATLVLVDQCTMGRDVRNTLQILDDRISRRHALIERTETQWIFKDLGSLNGSFVNDVRIKTQVALHHCDRIRLGDSVLVFRHRNKPDAPSTLAKPEMLLSLLDVPVDSSFIQAEVDARDIQGAPEIEAEENLQTVKRAYRKLLLAFQVHEQLAQITSLQTVLDRVLQVVFEIFPVDRGAILMDDSSGQLKPRVSRIRERSDLGAEIRVSRTLLDYVRQRGRAVLVQDAQLEIGTQSIFMDNVRQAMSVPLLGKEKLLGVLHVDTAGGEDRRLTNEDLDILTGIGNQVAAALERVQLDEQVVRETQLRQTLGRYLSQELVHQISSSKIQIQMGGETKQVTVLFSDIRGFTTLSETMEPAAVVDLLNDYFELMVECIFRHGGTLDKYIGDAIMAEWGTPIADPLGPFNAVLAALEMQIELTHFNLLRASRNLAPVFMGIGINSGFALAGNLGSPKRMEYTVIGDTVNLASRIEHLTEGGQILVSESTRRELGASMQADPMPPTKVKGKQAEVRTFLVRGLYSPVEREDERRAHRRMKVCIPARVTCAGVHLGAVVDDLSPISVGLQVPVVGATDFTAGTPVTVRFDPWGQGAPLEVTGTVADSRMVLKVKDQTFPRLVVSLHNLEPAALAELARFLRPQGP